MMGASCSFLLVCLPPPPLPPKCDHHRPLAEQTTPGLLFHIDGLLGFAFRGPSRALEWQAGAKRTCPESYKLSCTRRWIAGTCHQLLQHALLVYCQGALHHPPAHHLCKMFGTWHSVRWVFAVYINKLSFIVSITATITIILDINTRTIATTAPTSPVKA